jgi:hypothetical protein
MSRYCRPVGRRPGRADPDATRAYRLTYSSLRTPGMKAVVDPRRPGVYHRSLVGDLSLTAAAWRE